MAKTKKNDPSFIKDIVKKYGNVISTGNQILERRKDYKIVSVSPAIDLALNGGIKEGYTNYPDEAGNLGVAGKYALMEPSRIRKSLALARAQAHDAASSANRWPAGEDET